MLTQGDDDGDPPRLWLPDATFPGTAFTRSLGDKIAESIGVCADPEAQRAALCAAQHAPVAQNATARSTQRCDTRAKRFPLACAFALRVHLHVVPVEAASCMSE